MCNYLDRSRHSEPGMGKSVVRARRVPTSTDSGRASDAAYGTPRLLSALAADHRR